MLRELRERQRHPLREVEAEEPSSSKQQQHTEDTLIIMTSMEREMRQAKPTRTITPTATTHEEPVFVITVVG